MSFVSAAGEEGITAADCVQKSKDCGYREDTVRSLLSREKGRAFIYDGKRYRLKTYAGPRSVA